MNSRTPIGPMLSDLVRHVGLFDLSGRLGRDALEIASADVKNNFDNQESPDGTSWAPLTDHYRNWKERHFPGRPIGVRMGELREHLIGEREQSPTVASVAIGATIEAADKAAWLHEGDETRNRFARPFIGFSESGRAQSDRLFDDYFQRVMP